MVRLYSLSQWPTFKLLGITYLVGKKKFKLLFEGPLAEKMTFLLGLGLFSGAMSVKLLGSTASISKTCGPEYGTYQRGSPRMDRKEGPIGSDNLFVARAWNCFPRKYMKIHENTCLF